MDNEQQQPFIDQSCTNRDPTDSPAEVVVPIAAGQGHIAGAAEDHAADTGLGPGRIRKYADEDPNSENWRRHKKHFLVLSNAGKPVYSRYGDENKLSSMVGVIQAIVSVYQDCDDTIRSVDFGSMRIVFLIRGPLYFLLASKTCEPESALREQLQWLYHQIISIVTAAQLHKIFERHTNFDLRRLLGGTETFLDHICRSTGSVPSYILGAIRALRMNAQLRQSAGLALQSARASSVAKEALVYGMLIAGDQLITILRPKRHSFHPSDLHLIFNMVNSSTSFKSAPESWLPICLPKFNDKCFLHAYISFLIPSYPGPASDLCLILVSQDRDKFFEMAECKRAILQHLNSSGSLFSLQDAIRKSSFSPDDVGVSGVRHFIYKSKSNIQFTMPSFGEPYKSNRKQQKKVMRLYQYVRSYMLQRVNPSKMYYYVGNCETVLGLVTQTFELYVLFGPLITKQNAANAANSVLKWLRKEEETVFVINAPTFSN